jgi:hypothetical protein
MNLFLFCFIIAVIKTVNDQADKDEFCEDDSINEEAHNKISK